MSALGGVTVALLANATDASFGPLEPAVATSLWPLRGRPVVYYPLAALIAAGCRRIDIVSRAEDRAAMRRLLGDGRQLGIEIEHSVAAACTDGDADVLARLRDLHHDSRCIIVRGDHVVDEDRLGERLVRALAQGATRVSIGDGDALDLVIDSPGALWHAESHLRALEGGDGRALGVVEAAAFDRGLIDEDELARAVASFAGSEYGRDLERIRASRLVGAGGG